MTEVETGDSEKITLDELLERRALSALELQREDGSLPPGRNYSYDEPETPVRTTSQWAIVFSEVYNNTTNEVFREAANDAVDYLLSDAARPNGYTFHCRNTPGKDFCNGLVGQAYPIKALAYSGSILNRSDAVATAEKVVKLHPFDDNLGLWERVEIDGKKLSFDRTLNHQILFAADCSELCSKSLLISERIDLFLTSLRSNMRLHQDGLIKHYVLPPPSLLLKTVVRSPRHWRMATNGLAYRLNRQINEMREKEIGYQLVNLRGLAQLKANRPEHPIWSTESINLATDSPFFEECKQTSYGSIIPGINAAWMSIIFNQDLESLASYLEEYITDLRSMKPIEPRSDNVIDMDRFSAVSFLIGLPNVELEQF